MSANFMDIAPIELKDNALTGKVIGAAIEVHRTLGGPGLLESIYEAALCHELSTRGLNIHRQRPVQQPVGARAGR